jgi:hypothetical protein
MARIKVKLADNLARVVFLESDATKGATLSTNLYLPNGDVATPATLRTYLGISDGVTVTTGGSSSGTMNHNALANLTAGDPHTQYIRKATMTANGDLISRAAGIPARIPPGTDGHVLTMVSGYPTWSAPTGGGGGAEYLTDLIDVEVYTPADGDVLTYDLASATWIPAAPTGGVGGPTNDGAFVSRTGTFSMANGYDAFEFDTEVRDDGGYFDSTVSASRFTISESGWYAITGTFGWAANTTGSRRIHIVKNGDTTNGIIASQFEGPVTGVVLHQHCSAIAYLAAGEYVELVGNQSSGAALNASAGIFAIHRLGAGSAGVGVGSGFLDRQTYYEEVWDFSASGILITTSATDWVSAVGATGAVTKVAGDSTHFGVYEVSTGTNSAGMGEAFLAVSGGATLGLYFLEATDALVLECLCKTGTLPDGTNTYNFAAGLRNSNGFQERVDIGVRYDSGAVQWRLVTTHSSVSSTPVTATTPAITANTWYMLKIVMRTGVVEGYINGVSIGTISTNIPTATDGMHPYFRITKTAGTTSRTAQVDLVRVSKTFTTPRWTS